MLVLDISCQHLGDACKLESFCAPLGHRVGEYTILQNIYLYWIYAAKNLGKIYMSVEYIYWGMDVSWRVSVRSSGAVLGNYTFLQNIYLYCRVFEIYTRDHQF